MARVWSLDGHVYEIDEQTLEKYRIPDEEVQAMQLAPLPAPPAPRPLPPQPVPRVPPGEADNARTPDDPASPPTAP